MTTGLDEISLLLGEIRSDIKHTNEWFEKHEERDQQRFEALAIRIDRANGFGGRISSVEESVARFAPVAENMVRAKWMLAGFLMCIAIIGGTIGGVSSQVLKWFS